MKPKIHLVALAFILSVTSCKKTTTNSEAKVVNGEVSTDTVEKPELNVEETAPATDKEQEAVESSETGKEEEPIKTKPEVKDLGNNQYQMGDILFDSSTREIRFPGVVNTDKEILEYAIVQEQGKVHEALLTTPVMPFDLQVVMMLLNYSPYKGDLFEGFEREGKTGEVAGTKTNESNTEKTTPPTQTYQFKIAAEYEKEGKKKEVLISDWMYNDYLKKPMTSEVEWRFVGLEKIDSPIYKPETEKCMAAVYLDPLSLLNYTGEGNKDDETWIPHPENTPEIGTKVTLILRPVSN